MVGTQRRTVKKLHKRRNILKGYSKKKPYYIQKKYRRKKISTYKRNRRPNKRTRGKRRKFILSGGMHRGRRSVSPSRRVSGATDVTAVRAAGIADEAWREAREKMVADNQHVFIGVHPRNIAMSAANWEGRQKMLSAEKATAEYLAREKRKDIERYNSLIEEYRDAAAEDEEEEEQEQEQQQEEEEESGWARARHAAAAAAPGLLAVAVGAAAGKASEGCLMQGGRGPVPTAATGRRHTE